MKTCEHGQLKRQCQVCELESEIFRLRAENERLSKLVGDAEVLLCEQNELFKRRLAENTALARKMLDEVRARNDWRFR